MKISKTRSNIIKGLSSLFTLGSKQRTKVKTYARLAESFKQTHTIETDRGLLKFRVDSPGSVPQDPNSVRSEPETFEWIRTSLKSGDTLWDIGANVGVFSLYAAIEKTNKVLSLEPSAESYATLNANIRLNGLDEYIQALCFAGSKETNLLDLFMKDTTSGASHNSIGSSTNQFGEFDVNGFQSVIAIKLDDLNQIKGVSSPDHIKLDVDGKELAILEGATEILSKVDSILIEIEGINLSENLDRIEEIISSAGLEEDTNWRNKGSGRNRLYWRNKT
ncbi:MAG: FkbM family methyltransferase [Gammaproteobacteria bacterium]|nr:MAG: FkbM family methyltransferase [Gammaproteobacteria bacterium]